MMPQVPGGTIEPEAIPMKKFVLISIAMAAFAGEVGIRPRPAATDYPAHQSGAGVTLGAVVVPADQVKKLFAVDLNKLGYIVVEMAVYPDANVEIAARDFLLRIGSDGSTVRPASGATIAGRLHTKAAPPPQLPSRVQVHGSETIGYESATYGGRRTGGVYTESTVGVGIGDQPMPTPAPKSGKKDTDALSVQVDLEDQALPEGRFSQPVAGYLYFPATPKKSSLEITWYQPDGQVRLPLALTK
jgi:hypothetical protein